VSKVFISTLFQRSPSRNEKDWVVVQPLNPARIGNRDTSSLLAAAAARVAGVPLRLVVMVFF